MQKPQEISLRVKQKEEIEEVSVPKKQADSQIKKKDEGDTKRKSPQELSKEKSMEQTYGKGFALLQSMGYKVGNGLGKNGDGIINPVSADNKNHFTNQNNISVFEKHQKGNYFDELAGKSQINVKKIVKFEKKGMIKIGNIDDDDDQNQTGQQNQENQVEDNQTAKSPNKNTIGNNTIQKISPEDSKFSTTPGLIRIKDAFKEVVVLEKNNTTPLSKQQPQQDTSTTPCQQQLVQQQQTNPYQQLAQQNYNYQLQQQKSNPFQQALSTQMPTNQYNVYQQQVYQTQYAQQAQQAQQYAYQQQQSQNMVAGQALFGIHPSRGV